VGDKATKETPVYLKERISTDFADMTSLKRSVISTE